MGQLVTGELGMIELPPIEVSASSSATLDLGGAFSLPTYTSAKTLCLPDLAYFLSFHCSCHCTIEKDIYSVV